MPVGVEKVFDVEKALIDSNGEICDLYFKSAVEGVVIKWATQINDVLVNDSSEKAGCGVNPVPSAEIDFWNLRAKNLLYIYEQLREPRIRSMGIILEKTNSAYYSCFQGLFKNIVISLAEAKDICLYLEPLKKHVSAIQETEFNECIPLLAPVMHVLCLIWSNCRYYNEVKMIVLLKQVCNLLIREAKRFLDPTTLFHSDVDEAMQRVTACVKVLRHFQDVFNRYKDNLHRFFKDREPEHWNFHPNVIFERYNAFFERLEKIRWFFTTVLEFSKLEKVEIGGMKGRVLSNRVSCIYNEFLQHLSAFSGKSYDVLDPDDMNFNDDFDNFKERIFEMDLKLAAVLCQAFEDCVNLQSIFKV